MKETTTKAAAKPKAATVKKTAPAKVEQSAPANNNSPKEQATTLPTLQSLPTLLSALNVSDETVIPFQGDITSGAITAAARALAPQGYTFFLTSRNIKNGMKVRRTK